MPPIEPPRTRWFSRWDLLPLGVAVVLLLLLPTLLKGLPDPLPSHFDSQGRANGWTPQRGLPYLVFGIPAFAWGLLLLSGNAFTGTEQDPDGRKGAAMAPLRGLVTAGMELLMLAPVAILRVGMMGLWVLLAVFFSFLAVGVGLMIQDMKRSGLGPHDPRHYRWGLFYVNPDDPRIWVPKQLGLGWTLNFAHRSSWLIMGLLLLPLLLLAFLPRLR